MKLSARVFGFVLALVVLGLALGTLIATLLFREWVLEVLVVRLAYRLWILGLAINARPQGFYWALPIVAGLIALIVLLLYNVNLYRPTAKRAATPGYVAGWAEWLHFARVNPHANRYLYRKVVRLAEQALRLDDSALALPPDLPPAVEALLRRRQASEEQLAGPEAWRLADIVAYLETILEVDHDR